MSDPMTPAVPDPTVEALSEAERTKAALFQLWHDLAEKNIEHGVDWPYIVRTLFREIDHLTARAAAPDALRVAVEALAAETEARMRAFPSHVHYGAWSEKAMDLRDLLDDPALAGRATARDEPCAQAKGCPGGKCGCGEQVKAEAGDDGKRAK